MKLFLISSALASSVLFAAPAMGQQNFNIAIIPQSGQVQVQTDPAYPPAGYYGPPNQQVYYVPPVVQENQRYWSSDSYYQQNYRRERDLRMLSEGFRLIADGIDIFSFSDSDNQNFRFTDRGITYQYNFGYTPPVRTFSDTRRSGW